MRLPLPHRIVLALLACASFAVSGCRSAPGKPLPGSGTPRPDQVLDFPTLYAQNCAACHGARGKDGAAIVLANPIYIAFAGVANIQHVTAAGVSGTAMPPFAKSSGGILTDQQIAALAQGIVSQWGSPSALAGTPLPPYASSKPGDPAQGAKDFAAFCSQCHGADGGGSTLPNGTSSGSLVDPSYLALVSDQGLRSMIAAGMTGQGPHDWQSYTTGGTAHPMTDQQLADVVAWLASHRVATPGQVYRQQQ